MSLNSVNELLDKFLKEFICVQIFEDTPKEIHEAMSRTPSKIKKKRLESVRRHSHMSPKSLGETPAAICKETHIEIFEKNLRWIVAITFGESRKKLFD